MTDKKQEQQNKNTKDVFDRIFGSPNQSKDKPNEAENVSLIIKEWLSPKHIKQKTRLSKNQVLSVAILQSIADKYNIKTLKDFLNEFRTSKLSEDGKSSEELEAILKARIPEMEDNNLERLSKFLE